MIKLLLYNVVGFAHNAMGSPCHRPANPDGRIIVGAPRERNGRRGNYVRSPENATGTITLNAHAVQALMTRRDDAVETQWHLHRLREVSVQTPPPTSAFERRPRGTQRRATARTLSMFKVRAVAWRPRRPHGVQWRCHGVPTAL